MSPAGKILNVAMNFRGPVLKSESDVMSCASEAVTESGDTDKGITPVI